MTKKIGAERYRQMLFGKIVQRSLSKTRYKRLINLIGELSLDGFVIDWHLANAEMVNDFVEPVSNYEPTYAYA